MSDPDNFTLDDGAVLCAPGGVFLKASMTLVVADLHAGYVPTLQKRGFTLPSQGDEELHARLQSLLVRTRPRSVVIAGDLVHGPGALSPGHDGSSALDALLHLVKGYRLVAVVGNHDVAAVERLKHLGAEVTDAYTVDGSVVMHGDAPVDVSRRARTDARARGGRLIVGHHHPALTLDDGVGTRRRVPVFAHAPGLLCLPALTPLARGADLAQGGHAQDLTAVASAEELSVAVVVGSRVIPVGTLAGIRLVRGHSIRRRAAR